MKHLTTISHLVLCEAAFAKAMHLDENRMLLENILTDLRDKLKTIMQKFKMAFTDQTGDFKGFGALVTRYLTKKPLTAEEHEKLKRNFTDILKLSGVVITFPILGASGHMLLGWLTKRLSGGKFTTLPTQFASNLLGGTRYTTDGIDTPGDPTM
jgi:hypothetical protein